MWKTLVAGTTMLMMAGSTFAFAQQPAPADRPHTQLAADDIAAFADARLCPSADNLRPIRRFEKGGSGSSGLEFKRPAADAASDGLRWLYA